VIHHFGEMPVRYVDFARAKGIKVVLAELRGGMGVRPRHVLAAQQAIIRSAQKFLPANVSGRLKLDIYTRVDAAIALTPWEAYLMEHILGCPQERLHIIPNGVEREFFDAPPVPKADWLVCTATIHPRKRVVELAKAAVDAQVRVRIIGEPYSDTDAYYREFLSVVNAHPNYVLYEGGIHDRARLASIYRDARGFVLVSYVETLSLSALEAAATQCPLMLTNLPWARTTFGDQAFYCPNTSNIRVLGADLRCFYDSAPSRTTSYVPLRWDEVARQLHMVYQRLLSPST
jgi:glycosyltransferase involved in cell wall biosynthesis